MVDAGAVLDRPDRISVPGAWKVTFRIFGAPRGDDVVEQAPAGELHDAAAGDGVGRQRVARERGAIDDDDVDALLRQQHRRRRAGAAGADDDDVVDFGGGVPVHWCTLSDRGPSMFGENLETA